MSDRLRWSLILGGCSVILAAVMQGPQWLHGRSPLYQGIPFTFTSDDPVYLARVQESLYGRPEQSAEAFIGDPGLVGTQFAFLERWYGVLFRFTGLSAAEMFMVMDSVAPVLIFLSLFLLFRLSGCSRRVALAAAAAFCVIELYNLNRPIHMRESFLLMLWSVIGVTLAWRGRWYGVLLGGGLLGLLVGVYVWGFAFAWAYWGVFLVWEIAERLFSRVRATPFRAQPWYRLVLAGIVGAVAAIPAVVQYVTVMTHPLYEYASFRSGMHPGRMPESLPYSLIFAFATFACIFALVRDYERLRHYRPALVMLFAAFVYMNQQIVHGVVFNFVSHGIFSLLTAALGVIALAWTVRNKWLLAAAAVLIVYVGAIAYDGRYVFAQWTFEEARLQEQRFALLLTQLDAMPRARILSDADTSAFVAAHTKHDIVYSIYLKNVLMTHEEIARRFCMTVLPLKPQDWRITQREHLVYPDAVTAFGGDLRNREEALVEAACRELDRDPAGALARFDVDYILWNTVREPLWDLKRLRLSLRETASGDGWILYAIR